jgi:hypothetical protein
MQTDIQNTEIVENTELEPWQLLDQVVRKWAIMSQHEKVMQDYNNLKQIYD